MAQCCPAQITGDMTQQSVRHSFLEALQNSPGMLWWEQSGGCAHSCWQNCDHWMGYTAYWNNSLWFLETSPVQTLHFLLP